MIDLTCDERETVTKKVCPCCEHQRNYYDFWYFIGNKKQEAKICNTCFKELRQLDSYLAKVLDGVKIPVYETPVTKYSIDQYICSSSSQS